MQLPSLRHGENLSRQGCTPIQLHTHKVAHPFICTPIASFRKLRAVMCLHSSLDRTRISWRTSTRSLRELLFLAEKKKDLEPLFLFLLILLLYPISILSSKVTHNGSIQKYTQLVMLTHYSPLRGWLPSFTLGHKQNQTPPHASNRSVKWQMSAKLPPHAPIGASSQDCHLTLFWRRRVRCRVSPSKAFNTTIPTCKEQSYLRDSHSCSVPLRPCHISRLLWGRTLMKVDNPISIWDKHPARKKVNLFWPAWKVPMLCEGDASRRLLDRRILSKNNNCS